MKIAILGAGAMGSLFGGYLSQKNEVLLIDVDEEKVRQINASGIRIREKDGDRVFNPGAAVNAAGFGTADLVIVFVKSMFTRAALESNRSMLGSDTFVLTLQNGFGHENVLLGFFPRDRIILGTTQHNSSIIETGYINHGGAGISCLGMLNGRTEPMEVFADMFNDCGFITEVSENIQKQIWKKAFTNTAASVVTGVLQVKLGYLADNAHAWGLVEQLAREAVAVANADGMGFDLDEVLRDVKTVLLNAPEGVTSICADIRDGRKTEVDMIIGSVVLAAKQNGISAPTHEFIVGLVHAIEERP